MAGIFERMPTIVKSNANDLLSNFEDPEKMIDQTIIDATKEYAKAKEQALNTLADEKLAKKKLDDFNAEADKWHSIAAKALRAGNEGDARSALENESQARAKAAGQEKAYEATKAASKVTQMGIDDSAFTTFARMEEKAQRELAKAQAMDDLSVDKEENKETIIDDYKATEKATRIAKKLEEMRDSMDGMCFSEKMEILHLLMNEDKDVIFIDPDTEYTDLVK